MLTLSILGLSAFAAVVSCGGGGDPQFHEWRKPSPRDGKKAESQVERS